jgi:CRISPR-associated protein Csh2
MNEKEIIKNNSDFLFIYDAKMSNPNGDPDEENRPRMDYEKGINLVSDLRAKRYIRDYLADSGEDIFVSMVDNKYVTAEKRVTEAFEDKTSDEEVLEKWIDVRLFGATMTVKKDNKIFTGPIQFNWGYSLNKVELLEASITSHFSAGENKTQGTIGKDYRVYYSFIAFSGIISARRAKNTRLKNEDISKFDNAIVESIPLLATRSKIGQYPRLYLRLEYNDDKKFIGDLRDYIRLQEDEKLRDIKECNLNIDELISVINENKDKINCIYYYYDKSLRILKNNEEIKLEEELKGFNTKKIGE